MTEVAERGPHLSKTRGALVALAAAACGLAAAALVLVVRGKTTAPAESRAPELPRVMGEVVEVAPGFLDAAAIVTSPAVRASIAPLVTVVGEAAFDPTRVATVGTQAAGIVREVHLVEGTFVQRGDLLAEIESPGLAEAQADRNIAAAKRRAAELNAERERGLLDRGLTTAREYEQATAELAEQRALESAARERVAALGDGRGTGLSELRAPVSGIVAERTIAPGQSVGPGTIAFRVGSLDRLWVLLRVFERDLEVVRAGDDVAIAPLSAPDRTIDGKVAHVGSVIDPATRTADVRVEVGNDEHLLRPGQAVKARIRASGPARVALSVPVSAVTFVDGAPTVFVAEAPTRFVARAVELGLQGGDRFEVTSGLAEGEAVVTQSVLALKSELFR